MSNGRGQAGEGKLGCILWTLLLVVAVMAAWKMIPVKVATSELYDYMVEQAKWAAGTNTELIQKRILGKANELDLPVEAKQITVERRGDHVRMRAQFTVPVEFPGYVYNWDFDLQVDRAIYIW